MPNNYFQFKQFTIQQEKAALKVSTDSCLFGAWVSHLLQTTNNKPQTILDIGSGTGLLMLMLAQKSTALVDGIEIDQPSFEQAKENIAASPWCDRLNLFYGDVQEFPFNKKYDFIITNPPFYEGDLKSAHQHKNIAKHDAGLKLEELMEVIDKNLSGRGGFAVLLPFHRMEAMLAIAAEKSFYCNSYVNVRQTPRHNFFRSMILFSRVNTQISSEDLVIKDAGGNYSPAFIELLKNYYLYL